MTQPDMSKCEEIFATLVKKSVLTGGRKKKKDEEDLEVVLFPHPYMDKGNRAIAIFKCL